MDEKNNTGRSSDEIRAEIERTRAEMHDTVDQLEARISPGQLLDEVWGRFRQNGVGGLGDVVRDNPVPLALMGLGVAWLAVTSGREGQSSSSDSSAQGYVGSRDRAEGRVGPYRGDDVDHVSYQDGVSDGASEGGFEGWPEGGATEGGLAGTGSHGAAGVKERMGDMLGSAKEAIGGAAGSLKGHASQARSGAGDRAGSAMRGLDGIIHDQPLIAGALTFGLGLAAGLAAPTTRFENERMGARSDELKATAKQAASEMGDRVKETASETLSAAKDAATEIKGVVDDPDLKQVLSAKAREIAEVAKGAVESTAQRVSDTGSSSSPS